MLVHFQSQIVGQKWWEDKLSAYHPTRSPVVKLQDPGGRADRRRNVIDPFFSGVFAPALESCEGRSCRP
jgi:hypothetical protein